VTCTEGGKVADLVEKEGSAVCLLEPSEPSLRRAGKGAFFVSEELALQKRLAKRGAVDFDERTRGPFRALVNRSRDQLFAGAGFALDQDGRGAAGDLIDAAVDLSHHLRVADDVRWSNAVGDSARVTAHKKLELADEHTGDDLQDAQQFFELDALIDDRR
jgi:hypothetical protein